MSSMSHVPKAKENWEQWFGESFQFLQWCIYEYFTKKGKYQKLYAAAGLEHPISSAGIKRTLKENVHYTDNETPSIGDVKRIADRFHNNFVRNFGSLVHRFLMDGSKFSAPALSERNKRVLSAIKESLQTLGPGTFHTYKDVIKPLLRQWRGATLLEVDSTLGGRMMGELGVSLYYLLKRREDLFEMETKNWGVLSDERLITKIKFAE